MISMTVLGALIIGLLAACGQTAEPPASHSISNDRVLRYDVNAPFGPLDPHIAQASGSNNIYPLLFSYLFVPDINGDLQADLALGWSYDAQTRCWTFELRTDALFHNGQPVTAGDVKYSLDQLLAVSNPALKSTIQQIEPKSDHELSICLAIEDPTFLHKLWGKEIVPQPGKIKAKVESQPVGSGPFRFSQRKGNHFVALEANPDYFGGRPSLDRILFYFLPDREKSWTRLLSGETDIAQEISPHNYQILQQYSDRFYFDQFTQSRYTLLLYNTHDPLFSNPIVRRALTMGINRQHIIDEILKGYGRIATSPMGLDSPYGKPGLAPIPYDPDKALSLLKRSGWQPDGKGRLVKDGRPFEFTILLFEESQVEKTVARFIQLCLNDLGIIAHLKSLEFEALKRRYKGNAEFQAVLTELTGAHRHPDWVAMFWSPVQNGKMNVGLFDHPDVTQRFHMALEEVDPDRRRLMLQEIDGLIADLQPATFLFHKTAIDAMSRRFHLPHPFVLDSEGIYRLKDVSPAGK